MKQEREINMTNQSPIQKPSDQIDVSYLFQSLEQLLGKKKALNKNEKSMALEALKDIKTASKIFQDGYNNFFQLKELLNENPTIPDDANLWPSAPKINFPTITKNRVRGKKCLQ
jgi:hypothetical protein